MKKKLFLTATLVIAAGFGLVFTGCADPSNGYIIPMFKITNAPISSPESYEIWAADGTKSSSNTDNAKYGHVGTMAATKFSLRLDEGSVKGTSARIELRTTNVREPGTKELVLKKNSTVLYLWGVVDESKGGPFAVTHGKGWYFIDRTSFSYFTTTATVYDTMQSALDAGYEWQLR